MIYIRHSSKLYSNGKSKNFPLDPPLTYSGKLKAYDKFKELCNKFGPPEIIVTSPFLRTRQTAEIAQLAIKDLTELIVPIVFDPRIGEYLGNQDLDLFKVGIRYHTAIHNPIPPEKWGDYVARMQNYCESENTRGWYITHGLIIQSICKFYGHSIKRPPDLGGVYIDTDGIRPI